jgi:hypothetical protein
MFMPKIEDEQLQKEIIQFRRTAQMMGDVALDAMNRGDVGLARTASRQAAQYARLVMQLESGEKQVAPPEIEAPGEQADSQANSISV